MLRQGEAHSWTPTGVSFSAGGVRTIGHMGVLAKLLESGVLDCVRDWYGCSGGTLAAVVGAIGASHIWIRETINYFDMRAFAEIEEEMLATYFTSWGVTSGKRLIEFVGRFIDTWEPGSSAWTFADLAVHRPQSRLHITATNISQGCLTVFNADNTPHVKILDAVRASCSIPCYFSPWIDASGNQYCDGAVLEYYPWQHVTDKENTMVIACSETGIRLSPTTVTNLQEYIHRISNILQNMPNTNPVRPRFWIAINNTTVSLVDFHITKEERVTLFEEGATVANRWLAFRRTVLAEGTRRNHSLIAPPGNVSVSPRDPERMSEIPPLHTLRRGANPTLQCASQRSSRRWSL